jgi:hypothetical protein
MIRYIFVALVAENGTQRQLASTLNRMGVGKTSSMILTNSANADHTSV